MARVVQEIVVGVERELDMSVGVYCRLGAVVVKVCIQDNDRNLDDPGINLVSGNATKHIIGDNINVTKHYVGSMVRFDSLFYRDIESFLLF